MPSSMSGADRYAAHVVRQLKARGVAEKRAVAMVQAHESIVRDAFKRGVLATATATRVASAHKSRSSREIVGLAKGVKSASAGGYGHATGSRASRAGSGLGWAAREALSAPTVRVRSGRSGLATGSKACGVDPDWQPPIYGEDMSQSAVDAYDASMLASPDARHAFVESLSSLPKIHQYFLNKKNELGQRLSRLRLPGALFVEKTGNTKVIGGPNYRAKRAEDGLVACATYASISSSCPDECAVRDNGCYAQQGKTSMTIRRLDREAKEYNLSSFQTAVSEAFSIFSSYGFGPVKGRPFLRVHVGGDSQTVEGTNLLAAAVADWKHRGGLGAWSYTHAWFKVPRRAWGTVSTLASVDNPVTESARAREMGYAPAVVVPSFGLLTSVRKVGKGYEVADFDKFVEEMKVRRAKREWAGADGTNYIPCPAQVGEFSLSREEWDAGLRDPSKGKKAGVGCLDCRLCFGADARFKAHEGIMFEAHGPKTKRALEVLGESRKGPRDLETMEEGAPRSSRASRPASRASRPASKPASGPRRKTGSRGSVRG